MIQVYPFHGNEFSEVYDKLNCFLQELASMGVMVAPDDIRSNTKYYPDWDRTATTIEVFIGMDSLSPDDPAGRIRELHRAVVNGKTEPAQDEEPAGVVEAKQLLTSVESTLVIEHSPDEGYMLGEPGCLASEVIFWGQPADGVLNAVKRHLGALGLIPENQMPAPEKPIGDDFDPFLDADDMP